MEIVFDKPKSTIKLEHRLEHICSGSLVLINEKPYLVTDLFTADLCSYHHGEKLTHRLCLDQKGLRASFGKSTLVELIAHSDDVIITTKGNKK